MVAVSEQFSRFSPEEYLIWEEQQEYKHEYLDGEVYAMTGGSVNHGQLAANFIALLKNHLRGGGCKVLSSDVKVKIQNSNEFVYPDVSITCDQRDRSLTKYICFPCIIVEVLSPSTESYDRGKKFKFYRQIETLQDYILVNPNQIEIDSYSKISQNKWEMTNCGAGESIELKSINLTFSIEQLFEDIVFEL